MTRHVSTALAALVLGALLLVGARKTGAVPPLGPVLDPAHGAWALARTAALPREATVAMPGLRGRVEVRYDDRAVPHIFATSLEDAWRALGYVVARDRLFQMELQTLAGSGRLTELAGARALPLDREMRTLGMEASARAKYAALPAGSLSRRAIDAYAEGVNAYVASLGELLPLEYRLVGRRPARWEPAATMVLMNRMGWTLAWNGGELQRLRAEALVGRAAAAALYPRDAPLQEPIQPTGRAYPRLDDPPVPPPGAPDDSAYFALRVAMASAVGHGPLARRDAQDALGSNNWAVAPARSASGHALLAGDPHLELSIPSIWYEVHVVVPDSLDVYGVTIPGAPSVIIGFNRDVAWSFTNTESDVLDRWVETVDDTARPTRYRVDGRWRPLATRIERYRDAAGRVVATDTIRLTHRGPMEHLHGEWVSLRWAVLESRDDVAAFVGITTARGVADFLARSTAYQAPAQNMLVADRHGRIAIRSTGRFPVRATPEAGMRLLDGSTSATDWRGDLPVARYPQAVDPAQGFLASANQQPLDPAVDASYLGADWYAPWRAVRINQLLRADASVTPDDMRRWQTDPGSARADAFVPLLLDAAARESAAGRGSDALRAAARRLGEWDRRYTRDNRRAVLFEAAMTELARRTWDELLAPGAGDGPGFPKDMLLLVLARDATSPWWDDHRTGDVRETRDAIAAASLAAAYERVVKERGDPAGDGWRWDHVRFANIHHLLRLPGLSALRVPVQGGPSTLAPSGGSGIAGPSWRMVVEMDSTPRAWTIYPGGQSGNPASRFYRDRVAAWSAGMLEEALVPRRAADLPARRTLATLTLTPGGR